MSNPGPPNPFSAFLGTNAQSHVTDMAAAIMQAQIKMMDSVLRQNIEALDFVKQRFEKDRAVMARLAEVKDPAEAMKVMESFWNRSMKDYADEAGKMGALTAATAEQIVEGLTEEAQALAGGAPQRATARKGKGKAKADDQA